MLIGKVPGTDITLGMSRRLFVACQSLDSEQNRLLSNVQADFPDLWDVSPDYPEDVADERIRQRREVLAEREAIDRYRLLGEARQGYERGRESSWGEILEIEPMLDVGSPLNVLESATLDSYVAIDADSVAVNAA